MVTTRLTRCLIRIPELAAVKKCIVRVVLDATATGQVTFALFLRLNKSSQENKTPAMSPVAVGSAQQHPRLLGLFFFYVLWPVSGADVALVSRGWQRPEGHAATAHSRIAGQKKFSRKVGRMVGTGGRAQSFFREEERAPRRAQAVFPLA